MLTRSYKNKKPLSIDMYQNLMNNQNYIISRKLKVKIFLYYFNSLTPFGSVNNENPLSIVTLIFSIISEKFLYFHNTKIEFWVLYFYHIFIVILVYFFLGFNYFFYLLVYFFLSFSLLFAIKEYYKVNIVISGFRGRIENNFIKYGYLSKLVPYIEKKSINKKDYIYFKNTIFDNFILALSYFLIAHFTVFLLYKVIISLN